MWCIQVWLLLAFSQLLAFIGAASTTELVALQTRVSISQSSPHRSSPETKRRSCSDWEGVLLQYLDCPEVECAELSTLGICAIAAERINASMLELTKSTIVSDSYIARFEPVLIAMEALFQLDSSEIWTSSLAPSLSLVNQAVFFNLVLENECTTVFKKYLSHIPVSLEVLHASIHIRTVLCEHIIILLERMELNDIDLHNLLLDAISMHRLTLVEHIIRSEKFLRMQYAVGFVDGTVVSCHPLMYAISRKTLRDRPEKLTQLLSLLLDHGMGTIEVHELPFLRPLPLFMIPSTPLEFAAHYGCQEAINVLSESLNPVQLQAQVPRAVFFASDMNIFKAMQSKLHNYIDLQNCFNGVSLGAYAAFAGNFEMVQHLRSEGILWEIPDSQYSPIVTALLRADRDFALISSMVELLATECRLNVNAPVPRKDFIEIAAIFGLDLTQHNSNYFLTALDIAEALAFNFPDASNIVDLISACGGLRAKDL